MQWRDALTLCRDLQRGTVSSEDLTREIYARIRRVNPEVNAIVNLIDEDEALVLARQADQTPIAKRGLLHGLPMANKDAVVTRGFPTTWGFVPWADNVAEEDGPMAARLREAGAFFIGRTNMPEFGLGSNTFNSLFGTTRNPYNLDKTAGGSSGGAAVALATQMLPLADGSDMGGSLRNPASFCNVVGFRPSVGRMPKSRGFGWFARLGIEGPMARTVGDATLLFAAQAGPDLNDPLTLPESGEHFLDALAPLDSLQGKRIAFAPTLHGLPIAKAVLDIMAQTADMLSNLGAEIVDVGPDLSQAMEVFQIQRAASLATLGATLDATTPNWRDFAKDTAVWNIDKGLNLTANEMLRSELLRTEMYATVAAFFQDKDALLLPAAQVVPFDHSLPWIDNIDGTPMTTYIDWMSVCCVITVTGLPAISVPAGFTNDGLPVGAQLVGKPRGDLELLRLAHTFEAATNYYQTTPTVCAG